MNGVLLPIETGNVSEVGLSVAELATFEGIVNDLAELETTTPQLHEELNQSQSQKNHDPTDDLDQTWHVK